ncbi:guanylate kinase [Roseospira marina]|uniref:Guanylate kinase n=1 Tax=Roseospira marina TaxID=140057 RepID=A0A5M6I4V3_9PROT|nr:guanylate kinase [Roseospira marina]KAA5603261.1 guanylate kinase [Roseospira marina]MBB4316162.1 guanylate kinase [Roseospira marina]MBB5089362.1 guanylate kinase [Roseospira marina]
MPDTSASLPLNVDHTGRPIRRRGLMLVLSSPSGAGKSTISRALLAEDPDISLSVSVTTRSPRPGERDGTDYYFISDEHYHAMVDQDDLLEHARVFDHYYGTPRRQVEDALTAGRDMLFDIDWQGTQQLADSLPRDLVRVFILPPSTAELERRLRTRAQDPEEVVARRMAKASDEMSHWAEYDYVVVNTEIDAAIARVRAILTAERLRRERQPGLAAFVNAMREEA